MAGTKNPFEVFGLSPEAVARMGEKDLFVLIRSMYRTLQKVYHPDGSAGRGRGMDAEITSGAAAVELNLAFEKLNLERNTESFRHYRKLYLGRRKSALRRKISEMRSEIRKMEESRAGLSDNFMAYLMKSLPWLREDHGESPRLFPAPTNLKLGLNDVAINHNIRSSTWHFGSNYKEILFDALGAMSYRPVGRSRDFPVNFVHLLGTIPLSDLDLLPLLEKVPPRKGHFKCPALDSRYGIDGVAVDVLNAISVDKFKQYCLPLLRPAIMERSYLFSIHRPIWECDGLITLEGVVVKVSGF